MSVGIQFCGGCNPLIDRGTIAFELQQSLVGNGYEVVFNCSVADFVVFLSGCQSSCASKYNPTNTPCVSVAALTVDCMEVPLIRIVSEVLMKVRQFYEGLARGICTKGHECRDGAEAG